MVLADIGLGVSVVAAGLWSGLLLMLTTILHPVYATQGPRGFAEAMRHFLPVARRSPTNHVLVALLVLAPVVALVGLRSDATSPEFVLTAVGLAATVAGPLLVSSRFAEPNYDVMLSWEPQAVPDDWREARARWLRLNWIRAALTWAALACFVAATYLHLT
ncbi:hypothetical protein ACI78V_19290 [Geodermatophilus sp. SYSU D00742]